MTQQAVVTDLVARLAEDHRDLFEERAGILEFDAGFSREHAECLALLNIYRDHSLEVLGVWVLQGESSSGSESPRDYLLVTDPGIAETRGLSGYRRGLVDRVIAEMGGIARLIPFETQT